MTTQLFRRLNNLFKTDEEIDNAIHLIHNRTHAIPKKYQHLDVLVEDDTGFMFLRYKPLDILFLKTEEKRFVLNDLYKNNMNMIGHGVVQVYNYIRNMYANISRKEVSEFLKSQQNHLILQQKPLVKAKPIVPTHSNVNCQIDLIDMSYISTYNQNYNYILNCVDVYSRYCFLRLLKDKTAASVLAAFIDIVNNDAKVHPSLVQTDQGTEFMDTFHQYLAEKKIKHIRNDSYSPNQNAYVERCNKDIRKLIVNVIAMRNTNLYFDIIDLIQTTKNKAYNSSIKCAPADLWQPNKKHIKKTRTFPDTIAYSKNGRQKLFQQNVRLKREKIMEKYKQSDDFKIGDYVLLRMTTIFSDMRRKEKAGDLKKCPIVFAPILYQIWDVKISQKPNTRNKYLLKNVKTETVVMNNYSNKEVTANEIIHATDNKFHITMENAIKLNDINTTSNDLTYE